MTYLAATAPDLVNISLGNEELAHGNDNGHQQDQAEENNSVTQERNHSCVHDADVFQSGS